LIEIMIDDNKCDGCGKCVEVCDSLPYGQFDICSLENCLGEDCLGEDCEKIKEFSILKIENGKVVANNLQQCDGCGECMYICKSFAILVIDDSPQQSMGSLLQDEMPALYCFYCDNFRTCLKCVEKLF